MIVREAATLIIIAVMGTVLALQGLERFQDKQEGEKPKINYVCVETLGEDGEITRECNFK